MRRGRQRASARSGQRRALHGVEPFCSSDQSDRLGSAGEVCFHPADRIAADLASREQDPAAHFALGRLVHADRRIIEAIADLACSREARVAIDRRSEHEIGRSHGRRAVAHEVDEFWGESHSPRLQKM